MVVPAAIRAELRAHADEEAPNECCGVIVLRDGVAERYVRGRNALASPYRYELEIDPRCGSSRTRATSSPSSTRIRRRSRSRRAPTASSSGLWAGKPFLIYGLKLDELRAWRIARDEAIELPLE